MGYIFAPALRLPGAGNERKEVEMSVHKSLAATSAMRKHRNVLSRAERVAKLREEERWKPEDSVFNLPKVKSIKAGKRGKKKEVKKAEVEAGAEVQETPPEGLTSPSK